MTRLQKILGNVKTVEELASILGDSPTDITYSIAVSNDGEHLIKCAFTNCDKCVFRKGRYGGCNHDAMVEYLNAEIVDSITSDDCLARPKCSAEIIDLRDKARKFLVTLVAEAFKQGHTAFTVYRHLDEYIDVLEGIGLFEENELRTFAVKDLSKLVINKIYGDNANERTRTNTIRNNSKEH